MEVPVLQAFLDVFPAAVSDFGVIGCLLASAWVVFFAVCFLEMGRRRVGPVGPVGGRRLGEVDGSRDARLGRWVGR